MKQNTKVNLDLETALVKIAKVIFEYVDSQDDVKEIGRLDEIFNAFSNLVRDYHNQTDRLHPDLCQDFSEWGTLRGERLEALSTPNYTGDIPPATWVEEYRQLSLEMIKYSEDQIKAARRKK